MDLNAGFKNKLLHINRTLILSHGRTNTYKEDIGRSLITIIYDMNRVQGYADEPNSRI